METRKIKTISIRMIVDVRMPKPKKYANKIVLGNTGGYNGSQVSNKTILPLLHNPT